MRNPILVRDGEKTRKRGHVLGSPDGTNVSTYRAGAEYVLPAKLARVFLEQEWADRVEVMTVEGIGRWPPGAFKSRGTK